MNTKTNKKETKIIISFFEKFKKKFSRFKTESLSKRKSGDIKTEIKIGINPILKNSKINISELKKIKILITKKSFLCNISLILYNII